jgi:acetyl esterase/lipase
MSGSYDQAVALEPSREPPPAAVDATDPPDVRLGALVHGGLAPAILGIVDRGVRRRPELARALLAEVELTIEDGYPPVRVVFASHDVLVEDGQGHAPDLRIKGALPDLISLLVAPAVGGLPNPMNARGRAALQLVASRRVRVEGRLSLMRRVLMVIRV